MKINQIILEMSAGGTGSGSVASVAKPMGGTQSRYPKVKGLKPVKSLAKQSKKKGPYSNSLSESKVEEAKLDEDDLIIVPGQSKRFKPGFIPKAQDRTDHEVEMALSDLYQAYKNAKKTYMLLKNRTEEEGLEGWVQEKIIKANDYLNAIREYYEHQSMQNEMTGGVVGNGMAGESMREGAKVDRMVSHIKKSEVKAGKSAKDAESIAWATANKRGMLDNKNKK